MRHGQLRFIVAWQVGSEPRVAVSTPLPVLLHCTVTKSAPVGFTIVKGPVTVKVEAAEPPLVHTVNLVLPGAPWAVNAKEVLEPALQLLPTTSLKPSHPPLVHGLSASALKPCSGN
jgi:hypothetical protein